MPPVRRSRRLAVATRTVVEVVVERPAARPPARSTADKLAAAAATARSWRARVTECADRAYDAERGRIDWETVAAELRLPLIGCLHMFDASLSAVAVRRLPDPDDWPVEDERAMVDFVSDNFGTLAGDVWRLAGVYMNTTKPDCLAAYCRIKRLKMTTGVHESIKKYREDGVSWKDIHKMFPVYKDATERIREIVKRHYTTLYPSLAINVAMREFPSRSHSSIKSMHIAMIRQKAAEPQQGLLDTVDQEVQRQYESGLGVNWTKISRAVGLTELECLELCRFSEGKARWTYDPDTFCQDTADRMEAFIAKHYSPPPPAAPNFNAVSNYLWIDAGDCVRMAQLLRGEFEWTDEARARVVMMREQGMPCKEIARQLSPNLTAASIRSHTHSMKTQRYVTLTSEEKQRIRSIVGKNSVKMSFREVVGLVARGFACTKRRTTARSYATVYSATLPLYKARAEAADKDQVARDILSGATTVAEAARRLDVPSRLVTAMVKKLQSRMCSSVWTDQETEQLLECTRTHASPYNWETISALLGTKSPTQCKYKYHGMRRSGETSDKPKN
ncbi:hypothetical protein H4R18_003566 [Coemansia javaensis]|uniref:Myb-like domain-containing protein n=1 Tax=Coemansia javaensis TaxID=2761396 RepID=A0A9W8LHH8_9FUNG|nr:hypothetical protein H4R18_003566 [Coemansia javaensis]